MAYAGRESFSGKRYEEEQFSGREASVRGGGEDEESRVINELHTATPPMLVPRSDENSIHDFDSDVSYSHRPEEFRRSFEAFLRSDQSRIQGESKSQQQQDTLHYSVGEGSLPEFKSRDYAGSRSIQKPRPSALRRVQMQHNDVTHNEELNIDDADESRQDTSPDSGICFTSRRNDDSTSAVDMNQPTSLTSVSTMSPLEEVRTPYEYPREGPKDMLLSPLSSSPLVQRATSFDDPNTWSTSVPGSYSSKPRSYTIDRHNSWRQVMRQQRSRRSTGSSGKSPASAFLSMWSSPEEVVAPQPDDEGQMVGTDYVLGKQIGFGGFSTVKEAYKVGADGSTRRLAVKIVKKHVSGKSEKENDQVQAEFDHEVRIWRQLNYHHILSLEAVYETDYATFCFTKLHIGGTLFDLIKANRGGLNMNLARKYSYQLASALRYLHEDMRVVHRDIKLENCLLDPERLEDGTESAKLVLCDFGMAEWMTNDTSGEPLDTYDNPADRPPPQNIGPSGSSTSVAGSLEYASPELLLSSTGLIDPVVDIWAFGVVVYATLVGSRPFQHGFGPRLQSSIIKGEWNQEAVLAGQDDDRSRKEALDLIRHCLDKDTSSRWTIRQTLGCDWFSSVTEPSDEHLDERSWRL
ncbi:protein kinase, putative [Talaromyces stipitatus ATCC 10500]|uniref:Protein kinase, putative n=1 Tax=Talaromyces stipitatus (strain ATCC 10500 / CBS 375.48 / QM 6759 / NRRL 1006) TaxID=441959 RepID=B8MK63_TALSN|nr:protein kinase, putative [Talaromyces stipitatus ATCC 10500]EED14880.1 protein kinase, putative [Talaromyces stipitatus ATCC 10500]